MPAFPTKRHSNFNHGQLQKGKREELILVLGFALPHQFPNYQTLQLLSPGLSVPFHVWCGFVERAHALDLHPDGHKFGFDPYELQDLRQVAISVSGNTLPIIMWVKWNHIPKDPGNVIIDVSAFLCHIPSQLGQSGVSPSVIASKKPSLTTHSKDPPLPTLSNSWAHHLLDFIHLLIHLFDYLLILCLANSYKLHNGRSLPIRVGHCIQHLKQFLGHRE